MFDATELCRQVGIQQAALDAWIEAGWLRPERARNDWRFSTIDLVRAQFILDLSGPMGVNDEGVDVILGLLDQIHGLRRALLGVTSTMGEKGLVSHAPGGASGVGGDAEARKRPPRGGVAERARRGSIISPQLAIGGTQVARGACQCSRIAASPTIKPSCAALSRGVAAGPDRTVGSRPDSGLPVIPASCAQGAPSPNAWGHEKR